MLVVPLLIRQENTKHEKPTVKNLTSSDLDGSYLGPCFKEIMNLKVAISDL
jgi:hypothetical protein